MAEIEELLRSESDRARVVAQKGRRQHWPAMGSRQAGSRLSCRSGPQRRKTHRTSNRCASRQWRQEYPGLEEDSHPLCRISHLRCSSRRSEDNSFGLRGGQLLCRRPHRTSVLRELVLYTLNSSSAFHASQGIIRWMCRIRRKICPLQQVARRSASKSGTEGWIVLPSHCLMLEETWQ